MSRQSVCASAIGFSYAVFCGGLALASEGAGVGGSGDIEGHVLVEGGGHLDVVVGGQVGGDNVVEGRSVSVDRSTGSSFLGGFHSPCFPYGYDYAYAYGIYGACRPR
jgi:hypothetical protein